MFKAYYQLTKPGIIYGNLLTALGGFLLASGSHVRVGLLLATVIGMSLVIASACVFNNYIDRDIDKLMARTKKRSIASGEISGRSALTYATILGVIGVIVLVLYVNGLVVTIGLLAFFDYVVLYGLAKRRSVHGTVVGSLAGAAPVVAGYCAVTDRFDLGAVLLFLILVCWQMPHFYAIAMYRFDDYAKAKLPVLPVKKGMTAAKIQILIYIVLFMLAVTALSVYGYTGYIFAIVMLLLGLSWFWLGLQGFKQESKTWARKMFFLSLIIILSLSVMLAVGGRLP
jgi:heme o synthase